MPITVAYALNAADCPAAIVPSGILDPTPANDPTPVTGTVWTAGAVSDMAQKLNELAVRINNLARYGAGGLAILTGCTISEGSGLTSNLAAGVIQSSGQTPVTAGTKALTDASYNYRWALRTGVEASPVLGGISPPGGATDPVYLGRMRTVGGVITEIDRSGVFELRYGMLYRRTGDAAAPNDTPPAGIAFLSETAGGLYFWTGERYVRLGDTTSLGSVLDPGRPATGFVRVILVPLDGDSVTITCGGITKTYEFDDNASVGAGHVAVTIAGTAALNAAALRTAIDAQHGSVLGSAVHATDTNVIDLWTLTAGTGFTISSSASVTYIVVVDQAEERAPETRKVYTLTHTVTAAEVARGRVRIYTGLTTIEDYLFRIRTAAADNTERAYDGAISVSGGVLEFDASGSTDLAAGNLLMLIVWGV